MAKKTAKATKRNTRPGRPLSPRKLAANRANAGKSTGPKTPEGKARSSGNALKHGLLASHVVPTSGGLHEDSEAFDHLLDQLTLEFQPADTTEQLLVERIAACYWRLRRALQFESRCIEQSFTRANGHAVLPASDDTSRLIRYETMIDRQLNRCLTQLHSHQTLRLAASPETPNPQPAHAQVAPSELSNPQISNPASSSSEISNLQTSNPATRDPDRSDSEIWHVQSPIRPLPDPPPSVLREAPAPNEPTAFPNSTSADNLPAPSLASPPSPPSLPSYSPRPLHSSEISDLQISNPAGSASQISNPEISNPEPSPSAICNMPLSIPTAYSMCRRKWRPPLPDE
jgi:hypothetical protein